jgi:hypothetical protein
MRNTDFKFSSNFDDSVVPTPRRCEQTGCLREGLYRAPRARDQLNEYYWFCQEHVREYNKAWNYLSGMSDAEVEAMIRRDTCWQRPTWPVHGWRSSEQMLREQIWRSFGRRTKGTGSSDRQSKRQQQITPPANQALLVLDLTPPVDLEVIKARYKVLVKRYHPDTNGGSRESEERLKMINLAYSILKACYSLRSERV